MPRYLQLIFQLLAVLVVAFGDSGLVMYTDIVLANSSESLNKIRSVPMHRYEYKYDSIVGRKHMGILPADAARFFPESVDILEQYTLPNKNGGEPTILKNFPVVDKTAIFMHSVAALQDLVKTYDSIIAGQQRIVADQQQHEAEQLRVSAEQERSFADIIAHVAKTKQENSNEKDEIVRLITELEQRVDSWESNVIAAHDEYDVEMKRIADAQLALEIATKETAEAYLESEKSAALAKLEDEKALLAYQQLLAKERYQTENELAKLAQLAISNARKAEQQRQAEAESVREAEKRAARALREEAREKRELARENARLDAAQKSFEKRATNERELLSKRAELEKEKMVAEIEAKAETERVNEEINIRKLELKSKLDLARQKDAIRQVSGHISSIISDIVSRPRYIAILLGSVLAFIAAYYAVREILSVLREIIQTQVGKPSLVRETSVSQLRMLVPRWLQSLFGESLASGLRKVEDAFKTVILSGSDREQIVQLALATRNTSDSGAPYRHVLLHGPPGTGKTLIARRLAESSGMDYAIMSGGDVGPLGEDAVSQLHKLFRWAARSNRGLLLFIDEAEAFLGSRSTSGGAGGAGENQHLRNTLNALLYQTGTQSRNFMLILATNRPEDLDSAVLDRIDVSLRIGMPGQEECLQLVRLYMDMSVAQYAKKSQKSWFSSSRCKIDKEVLSEMSMKSIADKTQGFSGREISKLFIALQLEMILAPERTLTSLLVSRCLQIKCREHVDKSVYEGSPTKDAKEGVKSPDKTSSSAKKSSM